MQRNSREKETAPRSAHYTGAGLAIGAVIGMLFGLMLFENLALGPVVGAALGLLIGAAIDAHERR